METYGYVVNGYVVVHLPLTQAVVGTQVETGWNRAVMVIGARLRPEALGQGSIVVRGFARTPPVARTADAAFMASESDHFMIAKRVHSGSAKQNQPPGTGGPWSVKRMGEYR